MDEYSPSMGHAGHVTDPATVTQRCQAAPLGCGAPDPDAKPKLDGEAAAAEEALALRDLMKRFVQDMMQGKTFQVVVDQGKTEECILSLTPNLQYLQLSMRGQTHDIALRNVKDVCPGRSLESKSAPVVLDDLCDTLVLRNNECVTFQLRDVEERDEFTKCIKVLTLAIE